MARKSRQSFLKRQREARRAEKAALKRQKRMERRRKGEGEEGEGFEGGPPIGEPIEIEPIGETEPEPETVSDEVPVDTER